ncbi:MAG TPA: hypothetical protein VIV60_29425 [Polyangiaceae bacterium]
MKTIILLFACMLGSSTAFAQTSEEWDGGYGIRSERRSGFAVGADVSAALGNADGYPKDAVKLSDPRYEADTGTAAGGAATVWLGGSIRDWFTFGLGLQSLSLAGNGLKTSGGGFVLRPELYPLWTLGGTFRDLGVYTNFGLSWMKTRNGSDVVADGGSLGLVGIGVFHESLRWRHFGIGPTFGFSHYFSETMKVSTVQLGLRVALTSGP